MHLMTLKGGSEINDNSLINNLIIAVNHDGYIRIGSVWNNDLCRNSDDGIGEEE